MRESDFSVVCELWQNTQGIFVSDAAKLEPFKRYLQRNPGISSVAFQGETMVGAMLCGHDGLIGYIYHIAVGDELRGKGVGKQLVDRSLKELEKHDISTCRLFVSKQNNWGVPFWSALGWIERIGISALWRPVGDD